MKKILLLLALSLPYSTFAAATDEIYQVISFKWNTEAKRLVPYSIGSGTAVHGIGLVTNKHVVYDLSEDKKTDLILLCRSHIRRSQRANCTIPASVTAAHDDLDVALVQPLYGVKLFPAAAPEPLKQTVKSSVKLYGFPYSETSGEFGDQRTYQALKDWTEKGGELANLGDRITVTRGTIRELYRDSNDYRAYYGTDAKGDFGSSGGGAFTRTGKYIGIPSFKDSEGNVIVLAYSEIQDWLAEHAKLYPHIDEDVEAFYTSKIATSANTDTRSRTTNTRVLNRRTTRYRPTYRRTTTAKTNTSTRQNTYTRRNTPSIRSTRTITRRYPIRRTQTQKTTTPYTAAPKLRYMGAP